MKRYIKSSLCKYTKKECIDAIQWMFGYNKAEANQYYATANKELLESVVDAFKSNAKKSFIYDSTNIEGSSYDIGSQNITASVTAAIALDERFDFEFPDKEFEIWGNGEYAKCTVVDDKIVNENEVEYTIAIEYPENYWQLEKFLLRGIDEYMHELTDGSDYSFDAIVEQGEPKYFQGSNDMYVYTATVTVYAIAP